MTLNLSLIPCVQYFLCHMRFILFFRIVILYFTCDICIVHSSLHPGVILYMIYQKKKRVSNVLWNWPKIDIRILDKIQPKCIEWLCRKDVKVKHDIIMFVSKVKLKHTDVDIIEHISERPTNLCNKQCSYPL